MLFTFSLVGYALAIATLFITFPKVKKNAASIAVCVIAVFAFLMLVYYRPSYFRDTLAYENSYETLRWSYMKGFDLLAKEPHTYTEYGFVFIELIFKSLGFSFPLFSSCLSLFFILSIYYFCNTCYEHLAGNVVERKYFFAFYSIFLSYFGLFYNFVAIRSALSFAFLAIAACFAVRKKTLKMLVFLLIAFSIQRLSIIGAAPILVLMFEKMTIKKSQFLPLWIILSAAWILERRTHFLINTVGVYIQQLYNNIMHTGIYMGFDKGQAASITGFIMCFVYILNGLIYYLNYQENKRYESFAIIYLISIVILTITSTFSGFYRIVDYLYLFSLPVNFYCCINWEKTKFSKNLCMLLLVTLGIAVWGKQFLFWYLYD